ncbi:MAG: transcriptional repressor [Zoogloeaceae bacterium]|jgi:Fur family zinc uptake transcriptional regulator|nr:transcriptional repressor [Zoogloeaceae bacterium]
MNTSRTKQSAQAEKPPGGTSPVGKEKRAGAARNARKNPDWAAYLREIIARAQTQHATLTPIRQEVLEQLFLYPRGLKAYDLLEKIKTRRENATPPTIYRALDFLMKQGFAHKVGRNNLFVACRHASHRWPSLFLVCPHCRAVAELQNDPLMQTLIATLDEAGFCLDSPEVEISAICPACAGQMAGNRKASSAATLVL